MTRSVLPFLALVCWSCPELADASPLVRGAAEAAEAAKQATKRAKATKVRRKRRVKRRRRRRHKLVRLHESAGLKVRTPRRGWGTQLTVDRLKEVCARYQEQFPDADPIRIHDLSRRRGGKLKPHKSHRDGRDVDIRVVLNRKTKYYARATTRTIDRERMFFLVKALIDTSDVEVIFLDRRLQRALYRHARKQGYTNDDLRHMFQYPFGWGATIRHWKGHEDHIHVRFRRKSKRIPLA